MRVGCVGGFTTASTLSLISHLPSRSPGKMRESRSSSEFICCSCGQATIKIYSEERKKAKLNTFMNCLVHVACPMKPILLWHTGNGSGFCWCRTRHWLCYVSSVLLQRVFMDTASCFLYQIVLSSQRIGAYLLTTHVHSWKELCLQSLCRCSVSSLCLWSLILNVLAKEYIEVKIKGQFVSLSCGGYRYIY